MTTFFIYKFGDFLVDNKYVLYLITDVMDSTIFSLNFEIGGSEAVLVTDQEAYGHLRQVHRAVCVAS